MFSCNFQKQNRSRFEGEKQRVFFLILRMRSFKGNVLDSLEESIEYAHSNVLLVCVTPLRTPQ
jgi:hypothetical protein